jgi:tetratricopeptide (TPR) repeat protein
MNRSKLFLAFLCMLVLIFSWSSLSIAEENGAVEIFQKAIQRAETDKEKADLHKELGDLYVHNDDLQSAADEYMRALSLYPNFPQKERLQMAVYVSWADRYDEAIYILQNVLSENPNYQEARIHLARTLSWAGDNDKAIQEANTVLQNEPGHRDALLVKANALAWSGKPREAIPLYERLLAEREDFDARLGLAHACLAIGKKEAASRCRAMLEPSFPYQERELKKLNDAFSDAFRPTLDAEYSHYHDSDNNNVDRYSARIKFWMYGLDMDVWYRHTEARDDSRNNRADEAAVTAYKKPWDRIGIGAGVGVGQTGGDDNDTILTWSARTDINIYRGQAGVVVTKSLFDETAELIENDIWATRTHVYLSQNLTDGWFAFLGYTYGDYSDDNYSNDVVFTVRYALHPPNPVWNIGYRARYLNFNRQSGNGYFDPNDFISNQLFTTFYYERNKFYLYVEPYFGYQSFRRNGENSHDIIGGGYGSIGYRLTDSLNIEGFAEGGNFSLDSAAGFEYYVIGAKLSVYF